LIKIIIPNLNKSNVKVCEWNLIKKNIDKKKQRKEKKKLSEQRDVY
jgi:hypothetical protein